MEAGARGSSVRPPGVGFRDRAVRLVTGMAELELLDVAVRVASGLLFSKSGSCLRQVSTARSHEAHIGCVFVGGKGG